MKILRTILLLSFALILSANPASAQNLLQNIEKMVDGNKDNLVQIRLIAEKGEIHAGDTIWVGIEQSIRPHWHTYWKNPGDSGTQLRVKWTLPPGFKMSGIYWPTPKKLPYGPLLNYGYEDNVVLLQRFTAPETIPERVLNLSADIELLVCKEECIPEYGTYTLTLNGSGSGFEDNTVFFKKARSKLPQNTDQSVFFEEKDGHLVLNIPFESEKLATLNHESFEFFPDDWGLIENTAAPEITIDQEMLTFKQRRGERALSELKTIKGVATYKTANGERKSFAFEAQPHSTPPAESEGKNASSTGLTFAAAFIFAIIGGIILNLMPCVFPVLSIKALSLVKITDKHPGLAKQHGLVYTAGVVSSFIAIAALLLILKGLGAGIGWGFQLQSPTVIAFLAYLLFLIGLNLMGFFELGSGKLANIGGKLTQGTGLSNSFFTGVLATIVAAPCTAPFMAGAIGFALTQPAIVNLIIFAALGFGLALPYLLLSFIPAFRNILPKPGPWMIVFKQALSFPMFLSAIWLVWVLSQQSGPMGVLEILTGMAAITFGIWVLKHKPTSAIGKKLVTITATLSLLSAALLGIKESSSQTNPAIQKESLKFGDVYSPEKLETLLAGDDAIFVEMTAAWCITCKVNHALAINIDETRELFTANNVQYLIGDWTNQDPVITTFLNTYGRNGVPIYVYYGPRNENTKERPEPVILPQLLKPGILREIIKKEI